MERIQFNEGRWIVPDNPEIGYITGDGIGVDVSPPTRKVIDAAIAKAYGGKRKISWRGILAGEEAAQKAGERLPKETYEMIEEVRVVLKGPLTTPVGEGYRSLNVTLRQHFDLYQCIRPVRHYKGLPAPVKHPENVDIVIFRENTEDVYAGIEYEAGSAGAHAIIDLLRDRGHELSDDSGIGIKPISKRASERLVRAAMEFAIEKGRKSLTLVHKGNIMKHTEGAFRNWGLAMLKKEYGDRIVTWDDIGSAGIPQGKVLVQDVIADAMFQQLLLKPEDYDVIATMNLNGDYLSDAAAAQIGGLGIAPGANIGEGIAIFEATHGTAPRHAGKDEANPSSLLLSGVMMLDLLGWDEAGKLIVDALEKTYLSKKVTYDLFRNLENAEKLGTSDFADAVIANMG